MFHVVRVEDKETGFTEKLVTHSLAQHLEYIDYLSRVKQPAGYTDIKLVWYLKQHKKTTRQLECTVEASFDTQLECHDYISPPPVAINQITVEVVPVKKSRGKQKKNALIELNP